MAIISDFKSRTLSYNSIMVEKFLNYIMKGGKKSLARKLFDDTLEEITKTGKNKPLEIFEMAIENAIPSMEVRPKRIGEGVYQVPVEVKPKRQIALAFRWILKATRDIKGKAFSKALAQVLIETSDNTGPAIKKKEDVQKMADSNKTFAHLANF